MSAPEVRGCLVRVTTMRVPPPAPTGAASQQRSSSALLGRRRPTMEKPGWRSALMCIGILVLTVIAVGFMFIVVSCFVVPVRPGLFVLLSLICVAGKPIGAVAYSDFSVRERRRCPVTLSSLSPLPHFPPSADGVHGECGAGTFTSRQVQKCRGQCMNDRRSLAKALSCNPYRSQGARAEARESAGRAVVQCGKDSCAA